MGSIIHLKLFTSENDLERTNVTVQNEERRDFSREN